MVFDRTALPSAAGQIPEQGLSRRQFKRLRQPGFGLFERAIQSHPKGLRGSRAQAAPGTSEAAAALVGLRGARSKIRTDHAVLATWIKGVGTPPGLRMHIRRVLTPLIPSVDLMRRIEVDNDGALSISEAWTRNVLGSQAGLRTPLVRLVRRHLARNRDDLESALITVLRLGLGHEPVWDEQFRQGAPGPDLSTEATLIKAFGMARPHEAESSPGQPLFTCNPATLSDTLEVITDLGGIIGIAELVVSGKAGLTDDELALGRAIVDTFVSNASVILKAAAFRFGLKARCAGSVYSLFEVFGLIALTRRPGARLAGLLAVGIALVVRAMMAKEMVTRVDIDMLLNSIADLAMKSGAYMTVVNGLSPADRVHLTQRGAARLDKLSAAEKHRLGNQVTAFLDANPDVKVALGL